MSSPDRPLRIITEADLPEVAQLTARYFVGLNLDKMMNIAREESAIDAEYTVLEDSPQEPKNPIAQIPSDLLPEVRSDRKESKDG